MRREFLDVCASTDTERRCFGTWSHATVKYGELYRTGILCGMGHLVEYACIHMVSEWSLFLDYQDLLEMSRCTAQYYTVLVRSLFVISADDLPRNPYHYESSS